MGYIFDKIILFIWRTVLSVNLKHCLLLSACRTMKFSMCAAILVARTHPLSVHQKDVNAEKAKSMKLVTSAICKGSQRDSQKALRFLNRLKSLTGSSLSFTMT